MARMPGAEQRLIPRNFTADGQESVRGLVVHIMDGSFEGTDSWFRNHPEAQASAHFGTSRAGALRQWVDTADRAWAQAGGNRTWLSIENEGKGGDSLTSAQLDRNAEALAWTHTRYGVPLQVADSPNGRGLGYHAMGGSNWGGHTSCPGTHVVAQLAEIVARAKKIVGSGGAGGSQPSGSGIARYQVTINGLVYGYGAHGDHVTKVGEALVARGCGKHYRQGPGPDWGDADTENYADYQRSLGYSGADSDGVPGEASLRRLLGTLPSAPAKRVSLAYVLAAARTDPGAAQGHQTHAADVRIVEAALKDEGLLAAAYASDGSYGTTTIAAYARWQRSLGYSGSDADGIPGRVSLTQLGKKHHFTVAA
ncbi:peptidoglycan-binding protein [Streptomyces sp. NPDC056160]|uniref:peptidoglycan-binding protein n=1 Tax=Streptomyces sp. NPDC056160 TaxID=3345731 RepID=UPI0035DC0F01